MPTMFETMLLALTLNLYMESEGEGFRGMELVADVTVNRVMSSNYPDNILDVVLEPKQFSWTSRLKSRDFEGLVALQRSILNSKKFTPRKMKVYQDAERIARKALQRGYKPKVKYTHFHSIGVNPNWSRNRWGYRWNNHIFYEI
ncbi:MAG: cell wall hydrolase [Lactococcus garvieae]